MKMHIKIINELLIGLPVMEQAGTTMRGVQGLYMPVNYKPPVNQLLASVVARLSGSSGISVMLPDSVNRNDPFNNNHTFGHRKVAVKTVGSENSPLV